MGQHNPQLYIPPAMVATEKPEPQRVAVIGEFILVACLDLTFALMVYGGRSQVLDGIYRRHLLLSIIFSLTPLIIGVLWWKVKRFTGRNVVPSLFVWLAAWAIVVIHVAVPKL